MKSNSHEELKTIFDYVFEMMKFGEAKAGGLIAFNSGLLIGLLSIIEKIQDYPAIKLAMPLFLFLLGISLWFCFLAVAPRKQLKTTSKSKNNVKPDIFSTVYLSSLSSQELLDYLKKIGFSSNFSPFEQNMAKEIILNSYVSCAKYAWFKRALISTLCALGLAFIYVTGIFLSQIF